MGPRSQAAGFLAASPLALGPLNFCLWRTWARAGQAVLAQPERQVHPALSALAVGLPAQPDLLEQPAPAAVPLAHPVPQVRRERVGLLVHLESELQAPQGLPVDRLELRVLQVPRVRLDGKDRKVH